MSEQEQTSVETEFVSSFPVEGAKVEHPGTGYGHRTEDGLVEQGLAQPQPDIFDNGQHGPDIFAPVHEADVFDPKLFHKGSAILTVDPFDDPGRHTLEDPFRH